MDKNKKNAEGRKLLVDFERTILMAKARAYSRLSLERPLDPEEHEKFIQIGEQLGIKVRNNEVKPCQQKA